jgi:hypothetical protein
MTGHSGEHWVIELALAAHSRSFAALEREMDAFQPLPLKAFEPRAAQMWSQMRLINADKSDAELRSFIEKQIQLGYSPEMQRLNRFVEPFASESVSIAVLAHAFAEATINAILALGLAHTMKQDLFVVLEQASVKDKWTVGPQSFLPGYSFVKSSQLFGDLTVLCKRRNAYVHSKITVRDAAGNVIVDGTGNASISFAQAERTQIRRFLELPYALHRYVCEQVNERELRRSLEFLIEGNPLRGSEDA